MAYEQSPMRYLSWKENFQISTELALTRAPASTLDCWVGKSDEAFCAAVAELCGGRAREMQPGRVLHSSGCARRAARSGPRPPRPARRRLSFPTERKVKLSGRPGAKFCAGEGEPDYCNGTRSAELVHLHCAFSHFRWMLCVQYGHFVHDSKKTRFFYLTF